MGIIAGALFLKVPQILKIVNSRETSRAKKVAGINPDYSYGRNNWEAFKQILNRFGVEYEVVAEQWPKVGTLDLTSNVAALNAAKPDLIFSSMLVIAWCRFAANSAKEPNLTKTSANALSVCMGTCPAIS